VIPSFANVRVLCIGDVILDRYVSGKVHRLSPEAPIPVVSVDSVRNVLGGAANVANNIAAAGARCTFYGVLGEDAAGTTMREVLSHCSAITPFIFTTPHRKTTVKARIVVGRQQLMRLDEEIVEPIDSTLCQEILTSIETQVSQHDAIVLSDYDKGALPMELTQSLVAIAKAHKKPIIADPKGLSYEKYRGVSVLTPNLKELESVFGAFSDIDDACQKAQRALSQYDLQAIVLTCSEAGMCLITSERIEKVPAIQQDVCDVSGAGDTAVAYMAVALAAGLSLENAVILANCAAGQAVRKSGTAVVSYDEINSLRPPSSWSQKCLSLEEVLIKARDWRRQGLKIGFTNGCFDILHPGHLSTIRIARENCDVLVVGLNTDASIHVVKGSSRPFQSEHVRAEIIASLQDVDAVVLFDSYTPEALIAAIQPDVLVKGAEYRVEDLAGAQEVIARGGKVILANMEVGFSTTQFVETIRCNQQKVE
jgi:D-beta-D-heptose 7-phosphate kinase/D-beta-D-heptose 1-phosphate adenosyltransferase